MDGWIGTAEHVNLMQLLALDGTCLNFQTFETHFIIWSTQSQAHSMNHYTCRYLSWSLWFNEKEMEYEEVNTCADLWKLHHQLRVFWDWLFLGQTTRGTQIPQAPPVLATPEVAIPTAMPTVAVPAEASTPIMPTATQPAAVPAEPAVPATAVPVVGAVSAATEAKVAAAMPALPAASLLAKIPKFSP